MLTVQTIIGMVEVERRNGNSQRRYHGYTTGAHRSEAAIGQANACADAALASLAGRSNAPVPTRVVDVRRVVEFLLIHTAVRKPASTAKPTAISGDATRSNIANTGSLNLKLWK